VSGWPGGFGGHWAGPASEDGGAEAAGAAGGQRSLVERESQQNFPEEEQPAQSARGEHTVAF